MKRILDYYMEAGRTVNEKLVKRLIDMPSGPSWSSIVKESIILNREKIKK